MARLAAALLLAALLLAGAWPVPAAAQELVLWRDQFPDGPERAERALSGGPPAGLPGGGEAPAPEPASVGAERWRITGAAVLQVTSPDPAVSAVLRYTPREEEPGTLRLRVIVIAREHARHYQYRRDAQLLRQGELVTQHAFNVGERGVVSGLAGTSGRVTEIVVQDDADAELRLVQQGPVLELQVVPPAAGGLPVGGGRPYYVSGPPLRFTDGWFLLSGYTENLIGELRFAELVVGRVNYLFPSGGEALLARGLLSAQAWRGETVALAVEGGASYASVTESGTTETELRASGGVTLHWRRGTWGGAVHAGLAGERFVLELYGGWQVWRSIGLLLTAQSFGGQSGFGLGVSMNY